MTFLCDETQKYAPASLFTTAGKQFADPGSSDTLVVSAARIIAIPNNPSSRLWNPQDPAGGTFRAAIGLPTQAPIAGTFFMGWGTKTSGTLTSGKRYEIVDFIAGDDFTNVGGTNVDGNVFTASGTTPTTWTHSSVLTEITTDLPYNVGTSALQTALNAMASITTAGGVTVTLNAGAFIIAFVNHGVREEFTADTSNLAPTGTIPEIGFELEGSTTVSAVQYFRTVQSPAAYVDLTDAAPGPGNSVDVLAVGGAGPPAVNAVYLVTLYTDIDLNQAYDGRWSVTVLAQTSGLIPYNATEAEVIAQLEAMSAIGTGNVSVFNASPGVYQIGFQGDLAGTNIGTLTVDTSALLTVPFLTGELVLNNPAILLLFGSAATVAALFVIEYTPLAGNRREVYLEDVTLDQSLIAQGSLTPTPRILFYTKTETDAAIAAAIASAVFPNPVQYYANAAALLSGTSAFDGQIQVATDGAISLFGSSLGTHPGVSILNDDVYVPGNFHPTHVIVGTDIRAPGYLGGVVDLISSDGTENKMTCDTVFADNVLNIRNTGGGNATVSFYRPEDGGIIPANSASIATGFAPAGVNPVYSGRTFIGIAPIVSSTDDPPDFVLIQEGDFGGGYVAGRERMLMRGDTHAIEFRGAHVTNQVGPMAFSIAATGVTTFTGNLAAAVLSASGAVTMTAGTASTTTGTGTLVVTGGIGVSGALFLGGVLNVAGATTLAAAVTISPASGVVTINPTSTGSINNMAIGGTVNAGAQVSVLKVGPSATPGTTINRIKFGVATLVLGAVTVGESTVTTSSRFLFGVQSLGTVALPKSYYPSARVAGASFTITSSDLTDTSVLLWVMIEP